MKRPTFSTSRLRPLQAMVLAAVSLMGHAAAAATDGRHDVQGTDASLHSAVVPTRLLWPGVVVIVVIAIFVTAALAGPLIRANSREEIPDSGNAPK
jgi:hypothetical protein